MALIALIILVLVSASAYFFVDTFGIGRSINDLHKNVPAKLSILLKEERDSLKKRMDEKYKANTKAFEQVFLELEKIKNEKVGSKNLTNQK